MLRSWLVAIWATDFTFGVTSKEATAPAAAEFSRCRLFLKRRVSPLGMRGDVVQQAVQDFTERHVSHFDFDAGPIVAEHELVVRRNRESRNSVHQSTGSTHGAPTIPCRPFLRISSTRPQNRARYGPDKDRSRRRQPTESELFAARQIGPLRRRNGSEAAAAPSSLEVRSAPECCRESKPLACPLRAMSDISHCGKLPAISGQFTDAPRGIPYRGEHCQTAKCAAADIEGHSAAAKFGQSR
jgi:hypothetical protein